LSVARGEIVSFVDDDIVVEPAWLESLWNAFLENPQETVIGGKIFLVEPQTKPWWYRLSWRRFWGHFDPPYTTFTSVHRWQDYPWGGNWAARRSALLEIGGFRSRFGRRGSQLIGGEEIIAASQLQSLGYRVGIEPGAIVFHNIDSSRFRLGYVIRSVQSSRRTWYQLQKEGYIKWDLGFKPSMRRIWEALRHIRAESAFKLPFTIFAEISAGVWLIRDSIQRLKRPLKIARPEEKR